MTVKGTALKPIGIFYWGLFGQIFSRGVHHLAETLGDPQMNILRSWSEWKKQRRFKETSLPKYLIGHSLGARAALKAAEDLCDRGHDVRFVICLDYVEGLFSPKIVPSGRYPIYHFMSRDRRVKKIDHDVAIQWKYSNLSHTEIDKDPEVHKGIQLLLKEYTDV